MQAEKSFSTIQAFLNMVDAHPLAEATLQEAFNQPPQAGTSPVQAWTHYLSCALLKTQLTQQFPTHARPLQERLVPLLGHTCSYEALETLLAALEHAPDTPQEQAQNLIEALDILHDYQLPPATYPQALAQLQQYPAHAWTKQSYQLAMEATFCDAHERSVAELIDAIASQAPAGTFASNRSDLQRSYQAVLSAYNAPATLANNEQDNNKPPKPIAQWTQEDIQPWATQVKAQAQNPDSPPVPQAELVAGVKRAVALHNGFAPRATQLLSALVLLNPASHQGRLAQINTGEGKSTIVAMLAAIHALQGKKVDVITTSTELSIPEVAEQTPFFAMLGLTVGENSNYQTKKAVYQRDIVYGTAGDFQGDILRTEFFGKDLRGDRGFGVALVDEVDSMLFDSRAHSIRLSSQMPAMNHLEPLLAAVWKQVNTIYRRFITQNGQTYFVANNFEVKHGQLILPDGVTFEDCTLPVDDPEAFIKEHTQAYLERLIRALDAEEQAQWEAYENRYVRIVALGKELQDLQSDIAEQAQENSSEASLKQKKQEVQQKKAHLATLEQELDNAPWKQKPPIIEIPPHLRPFAKHQIPQWIHNALAACCVYQKEKHYDVKAGKIVPIDYAHTGVLQKNLVWSDGLTQFLQIKEGLILTPEGISTNFISTPGFFTRYGASLYGLTGTLGNATTQAFFTAVYGTDMVIIPPYKQRAIAGNAHSRYLCKELPARILPTQAAWQATLLETTLRHAQQGRGVLVICQYIHQVKALAKQLQKQYDAHKILTYTGQKHFTKPEVEPGQIILATNIAGRGTDLKTTPAVEAQGGLHVCISFLPETYRVELQNAGRTARQGKKGSAQLILLDPHTPSIEALRTARDAREATALDEAKKEVKGMLVQDSFFSDFCAVENKLLPTMSEYAKQHEYHLLTTAWEALAKIVFDAQYIATLYKQKATQAGRRLLNKVLNEKLADFSAAQREQVRPILAKAIQDSIVPQNLDQATFAEQYQAAVFQQFCEACKEKISPDVLASFRAGQSYAPTGKNLSSTYQWGPYERQGVEERWGFCFKIALQGSVRAEKAASQPAFDQLVTTLNTDAENDQLIHNPYLYVLKGNEQLEAKQYDAAVAAYNRALALAPRYSVNARYNKVRALLAQKKNKHHHPEAERELRQAQALLTACYKPTLLNFHVLVGQQPGAQEHLSAHVQHQINILSEQEQCIDEALKVLKKAQEKDWPVTITDRKLAEAFEKDPGSPAQALLEAQLNGLTHLFTIKEKKPTPWWSLAAVALLGVAQITAGVLLAATTCGAFGSGLIGEGVSDLITAGTAAIRGEFSWGEWSLQKAISLSISLVSSGWGKVKEGFQKMKEACSQVGQVLKGSYQQGMQLAKEQLKIALAKGVAKECINTLVNAGVDKWLVQDIEKLIAKQVEKELQSLLTHELIQQGLALDLQQGNNHWQQTFLQEAMDLLQQEDSKWKTALKAIAQGVASNKLIEHGHQLAAQHKNDWIAIGAQFVATGTPMAAALLEIKDFTHDFVQAFNAKIAAKHTTPLAQARQAQQQAEAQEQAATHAPEEQVLQNPAADPEEIQIPTCNLDEAVNYSSQLAEGPLSTHHYTPSSTTGLFKPLHSHITATLTGQVQTKLLRPATSSLTSWGVNKLLEEQEKALNTQIAQAQAEAYQKAKAQAQQQATIEAADQTAIEATDQTETEAADQTAEEKQTAPITSDQTAKEEKATATAQDQTAKEKQTAQQNPAEKAPANPSKTTPLTPQEKAAGAWHEGEPPNTPAKAAKEKPAKKAVAQESTAKEKDISAVEIAETGIRLIKEYEGSRKNSAGRHEEYICPAGKPTIGYGHVVLPGEDFKQGLTDAEAEALLKQDIQRVAIKPLKGLIKQGSLTQNQYDAVVALVFNIGPGKKKDTGDTSPRKDFANSKTLKLIQHFAENKASMTQEQLVQFEVDLRREWAEFRTGGGKVLPGLVRRRQAELDLFFGHPAPQKEDQ